MTRTILVTDYDYPDLEVERSVVDGTDVRIVGANARDPAAVVAAARDAGADALLVQYAEITADVFEELDLEAVGRYGIGVDSVDLEAADERGVPVVNVPEYCVEEVPTHALSLLLTCARKTARYDRLVRDGTWDWTEAKPIDRMTGATLGLVGFGTLPRRLLELVEGFEFEVLVFDPYVDAGEIAAAGGEKVSFDELLERSKYVSIHAPLTEETRHLFDAEAFRTMRSDAIVVNTSRGELIETDALRNALESGEIAGAGIDVLPDEPPEPTPPIDHEAIVYTPHVAWYSEASIDDLRRTVARDVLGLLQGMEPINAVNDPASG